jgi:hypothetical protein
MPIARQGNKLTGIWRVPNEAPFKWRGGSLFAGNPGLVFDSAEEAEAVEVAEAGSYEIRVQEMRGWFQEKFRTFAMPSVRFKGTLDNRRGVEGIRCAGSRCSRIGWCDVLCFLPRLFGCNLRNAYFALCIVGTDSGQETLP